jgi:hypothetical protein
MIKPPNMGVFSALGVIRTRGPLLRNYMVVRLIGQITPLIPKSRGYWRFWCQ